MITPLANHSEIELGLSSRWERLLGQVIDGMVGGLPVGVVALIAGLVVGYRTPGQWGIGLTGSVGLGLIMLAGAWALFYVLFADGLHGGQSLGKRWLGMRVVDADTGEPCTFGQSFVRNLTQVILGPLDWIFIFGERRQRLGDKAAGTIVILD